MEPFNYVKGVVEKMSDLDFLKLAVQKMDDIVVSTEEDLILLDKVAYKSSTISRDFKLKMLTPELQEIFTQTMNEMKLDEKEFLGSLELDEGGKEISSSSKDSVIKAENLQEDINNLKRRMNYVDTEEASPKPVKVSKPSSKFSFTIKKSQGPTMNPLMQGPLSEDPHIENSNKPLEPGSERENKYSERKDHEYRWEKIEAASGREEMRSRPREPRSERKQYFEGSSRAREPRSERGDSYYERKDPRSRWRDEDTGSRWENEDRESRWEKISRESRWEKEDRESRWEKEDGVSRWEKEDGGSRWEREDGVSRWEKMDSESQWEKEDRKSTLGKEDQDFRDDPQLHSSQGIYRSRTYKPPLPNRLY